MKNGLFAQTRLFSDEMLALLNDQGLLMANWKWIALIAALVLGVIFRPVIQYSLKKFRTTMRGRQLAKTYTQFALDLRLESPAAGAAIDLFWLSVIDSLDLPANMDKNLSLIVKVLLTVNLIRLVYMGIEALGGVFTNLTKGNEVSLQVAPFATKTLKVLVIILGVLLALQNFGVNVVSLLAGLGLGGLALALAAQDTVANLFGSVTILFDSPFKLGDWIKIGDLEGNVEEIGFRSTRIRTFYNSIVTIPNAAVAKEKIDNMGARRRRRVRQTLSLAYGTPAEKIDQFCKALESDLKAEDKIDRGEVTATLSNFGLYSMDILIVFHLLVANGDEETRLTQHALLEILRIAQTVGVQFADPSLLPRKA